MKGDENLKELVDLVRDLMNKNNELIAENERLRLSIKGYQDPKKGGWTQIFRSKYNKAYIPSKDPMNQLAGNVDTTYDFD